MKSRRDILKGAVTLIGIAALPPCYAKTASTTKIAKFGKTEGALVRCSLCPRECLLKPGATGLCRVRKNIDNTLMTLGYSNPCAVHIDPIEKKPLYHVLPGSKAFSIAVAGCNLRCKNCQNYSISQASPLETRNTYLPPQQVVKEAVHSGCSAIAYTYSEPTVWYEYMYDTAKLAHEAGLKNLMITCGYINLKPLEELCKYIDAANIDLKSFDNTIYKQLNAGQLDPVLNAIKLAHRKGVWVEITNLIVPDWTDNMDMIRTMCKWIRSTLGKDVPLHFSRFHPMYKLAHLFPTPTKTLESAKKIAQQEGLYYVYIGNVAGIDPNTYCPKCKKPIILRKGYVITGNNIYEGTCKFCQTPVAGIW